MKSLLASILLVGAILGIVGMLAFGATGGCAHSPPDAPPPDTDQIALGVGIGLDTASFAAAAAQIAAIDARDADACLASAVVLGSLDVAHLVWRQATTQPAPEQLALGPVTVDASQCLGLGLPAVTWSPEVDASTRTALDAADIGLRLAERIGCTTAGPSCEGLRSARALLAGVGSVYSSAALAFEAEAETADGVVVIDLPTIAFAQPSPAPVAGDDDSAA